MIWIQSFAVTQLWSFCSSWLFLTRRLPMQSGIGANKQQMRPAKPEIFHKNVALMAVLLLIVMISMTEILVAMENLQRSRTLQQSKQRSRSDFKYIGIDWAVVIITFHDDANFVFTSEVISLVTVLPQLAHTVVTGSLSKTTLAIEEPLSCTNSTSKIDKNIAKSKRTSDWPWRLHGHYNNRSIHLDYQEHDYKKDTEPTWECAWAPARRSLLLVRCKQLRSRQVEEAASKGSC